MIKSRAGKRVAKSSYTATDHKGMVLNLESDGGKWLVVTCPFDPELVTQARSIDEAFAMAYDARSCLTNAAPGFTHEQAEAVAAPFRARLPIAPPGRGTRHLEQRRRHPVHAGAEARGRFPVSRRAHLPAF